MNNPFSNILSFLKENKFQESLDDEIQRTSDNVQSLLGLICGAGIAFLTVLFMTFERAYVFIIFPILLTLFVSLSMSFNRDVNFFSLFSKKLKNQINENREMQNKVIEIIKDNKFQYQFFNLIEAALDHLKKREGQTGKNYLELKAKSDKIKKHFIQESYKSCLGDIQELQNLIQKIHSFEQEAEKVGLFDKAKNQFCNTKHVDKTEDQNITEEIEMNGERDFPFKTYI